MVLFPKYNWKGKTDRKSWGHWCQFFSEVVAIYVFTDIINSELYNSSASVLSTLLIKYATWGIKTPARRPLPTLGPNIQNCWS